MGGGWGVRCSSAVPADAFVDGSISSFSQLLQTHVGVSSSKPQRWFLLAEGEAGQRGSSCTTGSRLRVQTQGEASSPSGSLLQRARCPWRCRTCSVWNQWGWGRSDWSGWDTQAQVLHQASRKPLYCCSSSLLLKPVRKVFISSSSSLT